jgi:hypothetical protein
MQVSPLIADSTLLGWGGGATRMGLSPRPELVAGDDAGVAGVDLVEPAPSHVGGALNELLACHSAWWR